MKLTPTQFCHWFCDRIDRNLQVQVFGDMIQQAIGNQTRNIICKIKIEPASPKELDLSIKVNSQASLKLLQECILTRSLFFKPCVTVENGKAVVGVACTSNHGVLAMMYVRDETFIEVGIKQFDVIVRGDRS